VIVLDTNVVSEALRRTPDERVLAWLESVTEDVAITAITLAELLAGVRRLPAGRRRTALSAAIDASVAPYRETRAILSFDAAAAAEYAEVLAVRERDGRPIHAADAQIAAICRVASATCATRNVADFDGTGIRLVDPWTA
jgi:predicted nucleic acid-binding protein